MRTLSNNKKAYFDFEIDQKIESGIILQGWEVKSVKAGRIGLSGAYVKNKDGELFLVNSTIPIWKSSFMRDQKQETRDRKLLLNKSEIRSLISKAKEKRYTILPLEVYENNKGLIKLQLGLAKGKKKYDKRQKLKERDMKKRIDSDRRKYNF